MTIEKIKYAAGGNEFVGTLVYDDHVTTKRPLLLVSPNWLGATNEAIQRTQRLVGKKYIGFIADMYGNGKIASGPEEAAALADALRADFRERRSRINAALSAFTAEADRRNIGDQSKRAAVGFCFGGGNVLELARTGADLRAVVCLHGDLNTHAPARAGDIRSSLLILHGSIDPVSPKGQRDVIEAELDAAKADWQMLVFGGAVHSFSESEANVPGIAEYDERAARQSFRIIDAFIEDAFAGVA